MKVKVKCCKCSKKYYATEYDLKNARKTKRNYNQGRFTCNDCGGFSGDYSIGMLTWNNRNYDKF
ncbi:hypothetical protein [Clostridium tertium]